MKGIKITTCNTIDIIDLNEPLYKSLQEVVGGYIEIVRPKGLHHPYCMIVDEEGVLKQKPLNRIGSELYNFENQGNNSPIVGDIVIVKEVELDEGRDISPLTEDEIAELISPLSNLK